MNELKCFTVLPIRCEEGTKTRNNTVKVGRFEVLFSLLNQIPLNVYVYDNM